MTTRFIIISKDVIYKSLEQSIFYLILLFVGLSIYLPIKKMSEDTLIEKRFKVVAQIYVSKEYNIDINGAIYEPSQYKEDKGYLEVVVEIQSQSSITIKKIPKDPSQKGLEKAVVKLLWEEGTLKRTEYNSKVPINLQWKDSQTLQIDFMNNKSTSRMEDVLSYLEEKILFSVIRFFINIS